jgi:MFS family permease
MRSALGRRVEFLTVLRNRDYRRYYVGMLASVTGHQSLLAAKGWLVYDITGEPMALGLVAAAQAVPAVSFNLLTGALADRMDPRKLIMFGEGMAAALTFILATLTLTGLIEVWHILVIAFLTGAALAFDQPARRALWPLLVPRHQFMFGASMSQGIWNGTRVYAPALGTGIIALAGTIAGDFRLGAAVAFYVACFGFITMVTAAASIHLGEIRRSQGATILHDIRDGLAFTYQNKIFLVLLLLGLFIGVFGLSSTQLMPALAKENLGLGPAGLGFLLSMHGVGGVVGVFAVASFGQYQGRPWLLGGGAALFGVSVALLGLSGHFGWLLGAVAFAALGGVLYTTFQVSANTLLILLVPSEFRGRVMGLRGIMWTLSPMGALLGGFIATQVNTPFAISVGGLVIVAGTALLFVVSKQLRNAGVLLREAEGREAEAPSTSSSSA